MTDRERNLPGGSMRERPYSQDKDGIWHDRDGKPVDRDIVYAHAFWSTKREELPGKHFEDFEEVIRQNIERAAATGTISSFINIDGLDEGNKMKLSALRVLAKSMGYEIGPWVWHERAGTVTAPIKKIK